MADPTDPAGVVELDRLTDPGPGAVWSLPHGGDLDANLVRLPPGQGVGEHVNSELDVLVVVQGGTGEVTIDGVAHAVRARTLLLVPRGAARAIAAGPEGLEYLSVHRRRGPLGIGRR